MISRKSFCAAFALFAALSSFAIEVNRSEIESAGNSDAVVFKNYAGPHTVINTVEQIRGIGSGVGASIAANVDNFTTAGTQNRYYAIHAIDPQEQGKLDADIFIIGSNATVDHVTNLRRIISAYLSTVYGYSRSDADVLATFVTVYNAVYRGNINYFSGKYKKIVMDNISADKVGLDLNYENWPGKTQLVIPLNDVRGGLSAVDTSVISDKNVIKQMQDDDDKNLDARKGMVDIKERESDYASVEAQESQKEAAAESVKLKGEQQKSAEANKEATAAQNEATRAEKAAEDAIKAAEAAQKAAEAAQKAAEEAQKAAQAAQKAAEEALKAAQENPNDKKAQDNAAQKQAQAEKQQAQAEQKQAVAEQKKNDAEQKKNTAEEKKTVAEEKKTVAEEKKADAAKQAEKTAAQAEKTAAAQDKAAEKQAQADKKLNEAQGERSEIAKDQQEIIKNETAVAEDKIAYGLITIDEIGAMSEIVRVNSETGALIKASPVSVIRSRTVYEDVDNFVAIAGTNIGNGAVKLVLIDKDKMEIIKESNESISETSVLVEADGRYYCVINDNGGNFYVGRFNEKAELQLKSPVAVKAATPITITSKGVLVTGNNGKPVLLNIKDLTEIKISGK